MSDSFKNITQFKAGYIADCIGKVITDFKSDLNMNQPNDRLKSDKIDGLIQYISSFDVDFRYEHNPDYKNLASVIAVVNNIITRGLPTRAPVILENIFSEIGLTSKSNDDSEVNFFEPKNKIEYNDIYELLHVVEPALQITRENYGGDLGSEGEWSFLDESLKNQPFAKQILQSQRKFTTINQNLTGGKSVDFSFEFPYLNTFNVNSRTKGVIFEYDGIHHKAKAYKLYDKYRDDAADQANFKTLRQISDQSEVNPNIIEEFKKDIFGIFEKNYNRAVIENELVLYSLIFIPVGVARIQKTILEYLLVHPEIFKQKILKLAIIERDLPCGAIAVQSLVDIFDNINILLDSSSKLLLPKISLTVYQNSRWVLDKRLHLNSEVYTENNEKHFKNSNFDMILDNSILRRSGIFNEKEFNNDSSIKIRSSHYYDRSYGKSRRVYCSELLNYSPLVKKKDDGSYETLKNKKVATNFFIQNIFRKVSFREGQLPIISRALEQKPVIGLLPTGGGKSLAYQLPAFLQPGLCIVVDPIKSLMEDQVRVLRENWIDCCDYINANLNPSDKKKKLIDFRYGEKMFFFVSPERFVMDDFRNIIRLIDTNEFGLYFSFCAIDEVHCVSEWGHDFRSTYLMLGKNAQLFCSVKSSNFQKRRDYFDGGDFKNKPRMVSLIGLTATASFDVLSDIERELQIAHDDVANAIIMIENTIRPELFFRVIDVTAKNRISELNADFSLMGSNLQKLNNSDLIRKSIQHHKENFDDAEQFNANMLFNGSELSQYSQNDFFSLIFCPVRGQKGNSIGVDFVCKNLNSDSKGFFYSTDDNNGLNQIVQNHFKNFTSGRTKHIVCTKAFGMGIDKKDIRTTYHYVFSNSLESLVQECGRSGRDKKISESNILVSQDKNFVLFYLCLQKNNPVDVNNNPIPDTFHRSNIRFNLLRKSFNSRQALEQEIDRVVNGLNGNQITKQGLITRLKSFIKSTNADRSIHDFFFYETFKGVYTEKSQIRDLFKSREFTNLNNQINYVTNQDTLENTFNNENNHTFEFIITADKIYPDSSSEICTLLNLNPALIINNITYQALIQGSIEFSFDFDDFILLLEEKLRGNINNQVLARNNRMLRYMYCRDRYFEPNNDTGRLIYRMHCMGFGSVSFFL